MLNLGRAVLHRLGQLHRNDVVLKGEGFHLFSAEEGAHFGIGNLLCLGSAEQIVAQDHDAGKDEGINQNGKKF